MKECISAWYEFLRIEWRIGESIVWVRKTLEVITWGCSKWSPFPTGCQDSPHFPLRTLRPLQIKYEIRINEI